jgi:phage shock protein A
MVDKLDDITIKKMFLATANSIELLDKMVVNLEKKVTTLEQKIATLEKSDDGK